MKRGLCRCLLAVSLILLLLTAVSASECNTKLVALTFDDGPCANTEQLLDGLAKRGAKATFFVQGVKAEQNEELIRRMLDEGHQVGNHSYDHPNLSSIPLEEAVEQLVRTDEILNEITGLDGEYPYRAPYGSSTAMLRRKMGAPFFKWSVDTLDWSVRHAWSIEQRLLNDIHDGAIILCHDTVHHTIDGALWAVDQLQEQGYEFVTIGELFRRRGVVTDRYEDLYSCLPVEEQLSAPEHPVVHVELFGSHAVVSAESQDGAPIYYTTDGAAILGNASVYNGSFSVEAPCTIRAVCAYDLNGGRSEEITLS